MNNLQEVKQKLEKLDRVERELAEACWDYVSLKHTFVELENKCNRLEKLLQPDALEHKIMICLNEMSDKQLNLASETTRKDCAKKIADKILE